MNPGALDGITILEFASYVSGPFAGMLLADLGATVIKIENPEGGDPFRDWGRKDYNGTFGSMNRNKKSVTVDLKSEIRPVGRAPAGVGGRRHHRKFPRRHDGAPWSRL